MPGVRMTGAKSAQNRQEHGGRGPAEEAGTEHRMPGGTSFLTGPAGLCQSAGSPLHLL